jgi:hypothetical protein
MRALHQILASLTMAVGFVACLSPTLPLPPPEEPTSIGLSSTDEGVWDVRGQCTPGAVVLIKNLGTGVIAGTEDDDADGRYFVRVEGEQCDRAEVWQIIDDDATDSTFFILQPLSNGVADETCQ